MQHFQGSGEKLTEIVVERLCILQAAFPLGNAPSLKQLSDNKTAL